MSNSDVIDGLSKGIVWIYFGWIWIRNKNNNKLKPLMH
jgi:hypothetical protein